MAFASVLAHTAVMPPSSSEATKARNLFANAARHRAEVPRLKRSAAYYATLRYVRESEGVRFKLSDLYRYCLAAGAECEPDTPDSPRRLLAFMREDGLMEVENVARGVYRACLTASGLAELEALKAK